MSYCYPNPIKIFNFKPLEGRKDGMDFLCVQHTCPHNVLVKIE